MANSAQRRKLRREIERVVKGMALPPVSPPPQSDNSTFKYNMAKLLLFIVSVSLPLGYKEVTAGYEWSPALRVPIGWVLWAIPLSFWCHFLWKWLRYKQVSRLLSVAAVAACVVLFSALARKSIWVATRPTYLYFVPTVDLVEGEKGPLGRAFVLKAHGPGRLHNAQINLLDKNSSGQHVEKYSEIDPKTQNPDVLTYFWWNPSHPWVEDYTITITTRDGTFVERMTLRLVDKAVRFAFELRTDQGKILLNCQDNPLPAIADKTAKDCTALMALESHLEEKLQPQAYNAQQPDGSLILYALRGEPIPAQPEAKPDKRKLTQWQEERISGAISPYRGRKIVLLATKGNETWDYARQFRRLFEINGLKVIGPRQPQPPKCNNRLSTYRFQPIPLQRSVVYRS